MGPRVLASILLVATSLTTASRAFADGPDKRTRAASEYDAGSAAFKKKDYEAAAAHFEQADEAVPSAAALRQAMRARSEAGQAGRAATLAALALERYPAAVPLAKNARETIEKFEIVLQKVHLTCGAPCTVAVASQTVPGQAHLKWVVYLDPGSVEIAASFDEGSASKTIDAKPGGESDLHLDPKKAPEPVVAPVVPVAPPKVEPPPEPPKPDKDDQADKEKEEPRKGISPAFFGVGAAAFVGLGAATIWSGVDTLNNPGQAAVRAQCQGLGTTCPAYQQGLAHQTRTNVLAGVTSGVGVVTIVLGIFTNWHGTKKAPDEKPAAEPTAIVTDRGGVFGARGSF
jgi:hypothetical protein